MAEPLAVTFSTLCYFLNRKRKKVFWNLAIPLAKKMKMVKAKFIYFQTNLKILRILNRKISSLKMIFLMKNQKLKVCLMEPCSP